MGSIPAERSDHLSKILGLGQRLDFRFWHQAAPIDVRSHVGN
jgi:hypothetical protein